MCSSAGSTATLRFQYRGVLPRSFLEAYEPEPISCGGFLFGAADTANICNLAIRNESDRALSKSARSWRQDGGGSTYYFGRTESVLEATRRKRQNISDR